VKLTRGVLYGDQIVEIVNLPLWKVYPVAQSRPGLLRCIVFIGEPALRLRLDFQCVGLGAEGCSEGCAASASRIRRDS
jgi:hypothetical protein